MGEGRIRPRAERFLHAFFFPGQTGYNAFRALLAVRLVLDGGRVAGRAADAEAPLRDSF